MSEGEIPLNIKGGVLMDVTEKYTLFCKEADEIQKLLHPGVRMYGTPFWYNNVVVKIFSGEAFYFTGFNEAKKETVWLPTQDQLQRMTKYTTHLEQLIDIFSDFVWDEKEMKKDILLTYMDTIEQFWLGYVMYMRFSKKWNNTDKKWEKCIKESA